MTPPAPFRDTPLSHPPTGPPRPRRRSTADQGDRAGASLCIRRLNLMRSIADAGAAMHSAILKENFDR